MTALFWESFSLKAILFFSLACADGRLQKIYERVIEGKEPLMKGPETVVFGNDGTMYILTEEAKLLSLTEFESINSVKVTAKATLLMDLGMGRPLGGKFAPDGTLYVADTLLGLIRIQNPSNGGSKVELVASAVKGADGNWSRILYADDVAIGPKTGMVYFSDGTPTMIQRTFRTSPPF